MRRYISTYTAIAFLVVLAGALSVSVTGAAFHSSDTASSTLGSSDRNQQGSNGKQAARPKVQGPGGLVVSVNENETSPLQPYVVLYDQYNNPSANGTSSQNFEVSFDAFDNELADDFVNPGPNTWQVTTVEVDGVYFNGTGPAVSVNVTFYNNAPGMPGSVLASRPAQAYTGAAGDFVINLSSAVSVPPGTYWMSVVANMDFGVGGQWGWTDRTVQTGNPAMWQNPGDGFASGCITWGTKAACGIVTPDLDQVFRLSGTSGPTATPCVACTATPTPTRTNTPCIPQSYSVATSTATMVPGVTDSGNHADDLTTNIPLPFPFSFYGAIFNSVNVGPNGNMQFTSTNAAFTNTCLPSATMVNLLSPHWDDLRTDANPGCAGYPGGTCGIYYTTTGTSPNRRFIIEWRAVYFNDTASAVNFEVKLNEGSTTFQMVYGASAGANANGIFATSGVQGGTGAGGLFTQYSCNTAVLTNGLQLTWTYNVGTCPTITPLPTNTSTHTHTSTPTPICPGAWTAQAVYPIPVLDNAVASQGGQLYSFAGVSNGVIITNSYRYDPGPNTWTAIAPLPGAREEASAVSDGTYAYILGGANNLGNDTNTLYRYNPVGNSYTLLASNPFTSTWAQAAAYLNGKIYWIAGCVTGCNGFTNRVSVYDIASNSWSAAAPYPSTVGWLMATGLGNYVYAAGGISDTESLKTYRYDPTTNIWNDGAIADLPTTRWGSAEDNLKGKWLITGGYVGGSIVNTALIWDPGTNAWSAIDQMPTTRARMSGASMGVQFFSVGGRDPLGGAFTGTTDNQRYQDICQPSCPVCTPVLTPTGTQPTNTPTTPTPTGTQPTKSPTRTRTVTFTRTGTPATSTPTSTPTSGPNYIVTRNPVCMTPIPGTCDLGIHCDDCATLIALPFSFTVYGDPGLTCAPVLGVGPPIMRVSSNGTLEWRYPGPEPDPINKCLPTQEIAKAILPHWDDLRTDCEGCGVFVRTEGSEPERVFDIEWITRYYSGAGVANFELRFFEGQLPGETEFQMIYGRLDERGLNATIGVQHEDGRNTSVQCNTGGISEGLALDFDLGPSLSPKNANGGKTSSGNLALTPTPTPTFVPCSTTLVGHVVWQQIPQNNARSSLPITLTLKLGATEVNYPQQNTDQNGYFTVSVLGLASGTYNWRVQGPDGPTGGNTTTGFLANCGIVTLAGAPQTNMENSQVYGGIIGCMVAPGCLRGGDASNDNIVSVVDFNTLKAQFNETGIRTSDFNNDLIVNIIDFNIMKSTFNQSGCSALGSP